MAALVLLAPASGSLSGQPRVAGLALAAHAAHAISAVGEQTYGGLPLSFEPNMGQAESPVRYLAHSGATTLFFTPTETVVAIRTPASVATLRIRMAGASSTSELGARDRLPGVANYLIGHDPGRWRSQVPTYARLEHRAVYRGIDVVYHGTRGGRLEYEFTLAPGVDPTAINLAVDGAEQLVLDHAGDLRMRVAGTTVVQSAPHAHEIVHGVRRPVAAWYQLQGHDRIALAVGRHDATAPLVIDPVLTSSTSLLGDRGFDEASAITVDSAGSAYITGVTSSTNFPTTSGALQTTSAGGVKAFVSKLNTTGTALLYSTYLGGSGSDQGLGIAVDPAGGAYVTGATSSADFPTTARAPQTTFGGGDDGFVSRLNASGSALVYSTYLGGGGVDEGSSIAVDPTGSAYVTGLTRSPNFPTTSTAVQTTFRGGDDGFVTKLNATGTALLYSTYLGGSGGAEGWGIAVDPAGSAYVTGFAGSADFPTTAGAFQTRLRGADNAFVSKLNAAGSALLYSTYLGGSGVDEGSAIAVDAAGSAYVTGFTGSADFPTTAGALQASFHGGGNDLFVTRLNATGTAPLFSTYLGGSGFDLGAGVAVDSAGAAYVTGVTSSKDFPTTAGAAQGTFGGGGDDAFVVKLNATGRTLLYSTYLGGNDVDRSAGIAVDSAGDAHVAGVTASTNFPTTTGALQTTVGVGGDDGFVSKLNATGTTLLYSTYLGGTGVDLGLGIPVDSGRGRARHRSPW